jgi:hypothetical protein
MRGILNSPWYQGITNQTHSNTGVQAPTSESAYWFFRSLVAKAYLFVRLAYLRVKGESSSTSEIVYITRVKKQVKLSSSKVGEPGFPFFLTQMISYSTTPVGSSFA